MNTHRKLNVVLQQNTDLENISINDVCYAIDNDGMRHQNQYLKPEGGLFPYKEFVNMLVKRFAYNDLTVTCNKTVIFSWKKKIPSGTPTWRKGSIVFK